MNYLVEWDDFPRNWEKTLDLLKFAKEKIPTFRCIIFAIPKEMKNVHWRHLRNKRGWIEVGIHGFKHRRGECRRNKSYEKLLSEVLETKHWDPAVKGPFYGFNRNYLLGSQLNNCTLFARKLGEVSEKINVGEEIRVCYKSSPKFKSIYYHTNKPRDLKRFRSWVEEFSDPEAHFLSLEEATELVRLEG